MIGADAAYTPGWDLDCLICTLASSYIHMERLRLGPPRILGTTTRSLLLIPRKLAQRLRQSGRPTDAIAGLTRSASWAPRGQDLLSR